jgi:putative heavy-metal chelation protein
MGGGWEGALPRALRQPKDALDPSAFSVSAAERWVLARSRKLPADLFRLTALWYVNFVRQPVPGERKTRYAMKVAQSESYGTSAGLTTALRNPDPRLVGHDTRWLLREGRCRDQTERTALVDLVAGHVSRPADRKISLDDRPSGKYAARARIFADEAEYILRCKGRRHLKGSRRRVLVIGATAGIIAALARRGFEVSATDLWAEAVGRTLGGVRVQSGKTANVPLMKEMDLAIVTGMTLPNRTLPGLMALAKEHNTSTMIWAITGKNLGHYYTEHGVDSVISDPSPFLLLPFPMTMAIWRRAI